MKNNPESLNIISKNNENSNEKTVSLKKKMQAVGLAAVILATSTFSVACGEKNITTPSGNTVSTSDTLKPGETPTEVKVEQDTGFQESDGIYESASDMGAENFIKTFGDYFSDPASVYNSELIYEKEHNGKSLIINPEYISSHQVNPGEKNDIPSDLGFEPCIYPTNDIYNIENFANFYDDYVIKQFDLYMNLISKNPSPEAVAIIDDQFLNYTTPVDAYSGYSEEGKHVADVLKQIVSEYGETATFEMCKSSTNLEDVGQEKDVTFFDADTFDNSGDNYNAASLFCPKVKIENFDGKVMSVSTKYFIDGGGFLALYLVRDYKSSQYKESVSIMIQ